MSSQRNPYELIEQMLERMNRQFDETARMWESGFSTGEASYGAMGIDLADRDDAFVLTADVPGFERDEIELQVLEDTVSIQASHEEASEERAETYLRSDRQHRSLAERVHLPDPVVAEDASATLQNGVLTIELPKAEPDGGNGHQIDIE